jgi:hypothetical protein
VNISVNIYLGEYANSYNNVLLISLTQKFCSVFAYMFWSSELSYKLSITSYFRYSYNNLFCVMDLSDFLSLPLHMSIQRLQNSKFNMYLFNFSAVPSIQLSPMSIVKLFCSYSVCVHKFALSYFNVTTSPHPKHLWTLSNLFFPASRQFIMYNC